jgi:hypothetical protein
MSEPQSLIDQRYREEVLRARKMTPEEKFLAGEELFMAECNMRLAEINSQNPDFNEEDCLRELKRRLKLQEQMETQEALENMKRRAATP